MITKWMLKRCSFCGSYKLDKVYGAYNCVVCLSCGTRGPRPGGMQDAIFAWNHRPLEKELIEALKVARDVIAFVPVESGSEADNKLADALDCICAALVLAEGGEE